MKTPTIIKLPDGVELAFMFKTEDARNNFWKHIKDENIKEINKMVKRGSVIVVRSKSY